MPTNSSDQSTLVGKSNVLDVCTSTVAQTDYSWPRHSQTERSGNSCQVLIFHCLRFPTLLKGRESQKNDGSTGEIQPLVMNKKILVDLDDIWVEFEHPLKKNAVSAERLILKPGFLPQLGSKNE